MNTNLTEMFSLQKSMVVAWMTKKDWSSINLSIKLFGSLKHGKKLNKLVPDWYSNKKKHSFGRAFQNSKRKVTLRKKNNSKK